MEELFDFSGDFELDALNDAVYEDMVTRLVDDGYIDYDGTPIRCPHCDGQHFKEANRDFGGDNIPDGCLCEFDVVCEDCDEIVAHWAFGGWSY